VETRRPVELRKRIDAGLIESMIGQLDSRLEGIISNLVEVYRERIPSYASAPPGFLEEIRDGTTTSYRVGLEILRGQIDPGLIRVPLEEVGRRRAEQGIPLGDALLAWQISTRTFWRNIAELAPEDPDARSDVLLLATEVIMELLEEAVSAISAGYLDVERHRVADEEFDSQTLVETLAGARAPDELSKSAAARLEVNPDDLTYCIVSEVEGGDVGKAIRAQRALLADAVAGRMDEFVVAFSSHAPTGGGAVPIGIARVVDAGSGYPHARAALKVALALKLPAARYEDVAPLALILDAPDSDRAAFVEAQLGPVLRDGSGPELLRSLTAYYAAGQSVAGAARDLHIHRHTLEYRLERLEKLVGPRLKDPTGRMLLELAMTLHRQG
jgi:DNA-binding PucR family transcriptional regulator